MDREKVIKALNDALTAKENYPQESARMSFEFIKMLIDLLKEQEAVKPEKECSGSGITWWNVCGNCKTAINPNDKFCHECGRSVKWE